MILCPKSPLRPEKPWLNALAWSGKTSQFGVSARSATGTLRRCFRKPSMQKSRKSLSRDMGRWSVSSGDASNWMPESATESSARFTNDRTPHLELALGMDSLSSGNYYLRSHIPCD